MSGLWRWITTHIHKVSKAKGRNAHCASGAICTTDETISNLTKIPIDNDMKFKYEAQQQGESGNVFSIWFHSVEDALLMQKTMRKHFKCPVSCTWSIDGETYKSE